MLCLDDKRIFAVADGMGGGSDGALASRLVVESIQRQVTAQTFLDRLDQIRDAICAANDSIRKHIRDCGLRQMGTTVALMAFDPKRFGRAAIGYVGDSRVYRLRDGEADLLTHDHSVGAELEERVGSSVGVSFSARSNPLAHVLTRAIGADKAVEVEWRKVDVRQGDRYLICSDGVHDVLESEDIARLVGGGALKSAIKRIEDEVIARGAPDNYTFILITVGDEL